MPELPMQLWVSYKEPELWLIQCRITEVQTPRPCLEGFLPILLSKILVIACRLELCSAFLPAVPLTIGFFFCPSTLACCLLACFVVPVDGNPFPSRSPRSARDGTWKMKVTGMPTNLSVASERASFKLPVVSTMPFNNLRKAFALLKGTTYSLAYRSFSVCPGFAVRPLPAGLSWLHKCVDQNIVASDLRQCRL